MAEPRITWANGPPQRGTMQVIWTCFSTLGLCVWTAVHPNIQMRPSLRRNVQARLLMMVVAILFPEIIISAAWRQLELARWLRMRLYACNRPHAIVVDGAGHQTYEDVDDSEALMHHKSPSVGITRTVLDPTLPRSTNSYQSLTARRHWYEWNNTQAFFAVMGGLAVDTGYVDSHNQHINQRHSLTAKGVEYLFLAGAPPKVSAEDVEDRNNSDPIAKTIVVTQITWFGVQIIARLVENLPLSALELHTVVHAGCAIIMYAIWKDKPYALSRPIVLNDPLSKKVATLLVCKDAMHQVHRQQEVEFERMREAYWLNRAARAARIEKGEISLDEEVYSPPTPPRPLRLAEVLEFYATSSIDVAPILLGSDCDDSIFRSMAKDAHYAYNTITSNHPYTVHDLDSPDWSGLRQTAENFTIRQVWGSWTTDVGHQMNSAKAIHFGFNLAYGLCHLGAWHSSVFPTSAERVLWRLSSMTIAVVFVWGMIWLAYWKMVRSFRWVREGNLEAFFGPFFGLGILFFALARCYLLVESLISLRSSPERVYVQVQWSSFFPHAG